MPPARRLKRYKNSRSTKRQKPWSILILITGLTLILGLVVGFFIVKPKNFTDDYKLSLVVNGKDEISVFVFDPRESELVTITIPASVEVDTARDLGKFKLGNVWQLGINEKIGGRLLQESVVKNLGFPVTSWAEEKAFMLINGNFLQKFSAVVTNFDTNLTIGDKIKIALFSLQNSRKKEVDLTETTFLKKTNFVDGALGYQITKSYPSSLILVFSENEISNKQLKVVVKNVSGSNASSIIPAVIEFSGAKVVSELRESADELFCEIVSEEKEFAKKISEVFGCSLKIKKSDGNFDVEISIGKAFSEKY